MSARDRLVVRILLLIARMAADEGWLRDELRHLANHIAQERDLRDAALPGTGQEPA